MIPCDAAVIIGTGGTVVICSMAIVEYANAVVSGRPVPIAGCQIFVIAVQIKEQAGAEEISMPLRKIGALIPVIALDVE